MSDAQGEREKRDVREARDLPNFQVSQVASNV